MSKAWKLLIAHAAISFAIYFIIPLIFRINFKNTAWLSVLALLLLLPLTGFGMTLLFSRLGANWLLASAAPLVCLVPAAFFVFGINQAYPYMLGHLLASGIGGYIGFAWRKKAAARTAETSIPVRNLD